MCTCNGSYLFFFTPYITPNDAQLIHTRSWLSASLNYAPQLPCLTVQTSVYEDDDAPEDIIRQECIKVTIIKAKIHHQIPVTIGVVAEATVTNLSVILTRFFTQLPPWLSLEQLLKCEDNSMAVLRPLIYYVHLFYLSAMTLLARRLVIVYISPANIGQIQMPREAQKAIEDGFVAAQTGARVLGLMLSEETVVQVCWLCM